MTWSETEHLDHVHAERCASARVMRHHGGPAPAHAAETARERRPYEPEDRAHRGPVLHHEARHRAMPAVHGGRYPVEHPEARQALG
ncbi:hypothetical protein ACH5AO_14235 [Streptomyces sp. NPDC018964]|uniref:hypothetical protein n=1 Tax=Streptomyces sp. NPDC018964 TaxID=3365058 RepID=UPI00379DD38B